MNVTKPLISLVAIFIAAYTAVYFDLYNYVIWLDIVFHFSGGFFIAMLLLRLLPRIIMRDFEKFIFIISITVLVGVLWEFYEYSQWILASRYLPDTLLAITPGYTDTLKDLLMDLLGGTAYFVLISLGKKKNSRHPL